MALIELNLEKPALKRVEAGEQRADDGENVELQAEIEADETAASESVDEDSSGGGRIRRYGRRLAILGGTAAGIAAARKLRQRRKGSEQQELEEDWQTAE
ncbi:hypothetical protein [Halorussus marinus]|uniref:hypothetical protein n=1 Tax=Halorussus marinus TaxID=2505976 RepID=UPI00106E78CA|nr:hypothetical protein [Halorussus marinus]